MIVLCPPWGPNAAQPLSPGGSWRSGTGGTWTVTLPHSTAGALYSMDKSPPRGVKKAVSLLGRPGEGEHGEGLEGFTKTCGISLGG